MIKSWIPKSIRRKLRKTYNSIKGFPSNETDKLQIRLITNRDSDNLGDQLIEECDISMIHAAMRNLGYHKEQYIINKSAAGIVSKKYLSTNDDSLLDEARKKIWNSDLVIFGGAPLFNYFYQEFYRRTIVSLEIAQEKNIPVLFSSIGVEQYSETDPRCQNLKTALNLPCVKQITTRDDLESLRQYIERKEILIDRVADPAVFSDKVFEPFLAPEKRKGLIGLVVVRKGIFSDNQIKFSEDEQIRFWLDTVEILKNEGYDYEFLTTGHFSDEVFLDNLCRNHDVSPAKCSININYPEDLIDKISSYDGLIAYRLHAGIAAYALGVPAIGLTWNQKVSMFYDAIGYSGRAFESADWNGETIVSALKKAMEEGVKKDIEYCMSVYDTLFTSMKKVLKPDEEIRKHNYKTLIENLSAYRGTTHHARDNKLLRKFRRTYENYRKLEAMISSQKEEIGRLQKDGGEIQ